MSKTILVVEDDSGLIPVLVMTGLRVDSLADAGLSALNLIPKPFDMAALVERIEVQLGDRSHVLP